MLPAPGRSDNPVRPGVAEVFFCVWLDLGMRLGMFDVGRVVMTTSSGLSPLVLGRGCSVVPRALLGPGDSSRLNDDGSRDRGEPCNGVPYRAPVPLEIDDGVDGIVGGGNAGLSDCVCCNCGRCGVGGSRASRFGEKSSILRSDSELRRFFLGGPVGMKLGCSPIVVKLWLDGVRASIGASPKPGGFSPSDDSGRGARVGAS